MNRPPARGTIIVHYRCMACKATWPGADGLLASPCCAAPARAIGYVQYGKPPLTEREAIRAFT